MLPNSVPEGHLLISLDTTQPVDAEQALAFMHALLFQLRQTPAIGSGAKIEIVNLSRGTIWAQVAIIVGTVIAGAGIIKVAAEAIQTELEQGDGRFAKETAKTLDAYRGDNCTILTNHSEVIVNIRLMPARAGISDEPTAPPEGFDYVTDGGEYVREDGEYVIDRIPEAPRAKARRTSSERSVAEDKRFTNIPVGNPVRVIGRLTENDDETIFVQPDGSYGRVDEIVGTAEPPHEVSISAMVSATRGEHGGFADRGIKIHQWKLVKDSEPGRYEELETDSAELRSAALEDGEGQESENENAREVALIGQLDNSFGRFQFEFVERDGTSYFAQEADDFKDMLALGQDVVVEATLVETDEGPILHLHHLRVID